MALLGVLTPPPSVLSLTWKAVYENDTFNTGTDDCFLLVADHSTPHQVAWTYLSEIELNLTLCLPFNLFSHCFPLPSLPFKSYLQEIHCITHSVTALTFILLVWFKEDDFRCRLCPEWLQLGASKLSRLCKVEHLSQYPFTHTPLHTVACIRARGKENAHSCTGGMQRGSLAFCCRPLWCLNWDQSSRTTRPITEWQLCWLSHSCPVGEGAWCKPFVKDCFASAGFWQHSSAHKWGGWDQDKRWHELKHWNKPDYILFDIVSGEKRHHS